MRKTLLFKKYTDYANRLGYRGVLLLVAAVIILTTGGVTRLVNANNLQDQIRALQQENRNNRAAVYDLMQTATSYKQAIQQLESQIAQLQSQINENERQKSILEQQIIEQEAELQKQRNVLGENIVAMYLDNKMTTIEMLATSKNLSEFIDKETYRNAVQSQIQETMAKIAKLQAELSSKKGQIEILLESLQSQRAEVDNARAQQANLLAMNVQQQAEFNNKTKSNQAKINELNRQIAAQRAANNSNIVPDGGVYFLRFPGSVNDFNPDNYPFKNAGFSMSTQPGCGWPDPQTGQRDSYDGWGYCTRQCVSYTAWAVGASGRNIPMYYGNAKNWVNKAPASYIYRTPQVGDVAITTAGTWGHAMYVEQVDGNRILVSQYNQQLDGHFSMQWRLWR